LMYAMANYLYILAGSYTLKPTTRSITVTLIPVSNPSNSRHLTINSGERVTIGRRSKAEIRDF